MPEYKWPDAEKRRLIGKRHSRIDGVAKATGAAKYSYDVNRKDMLWAKVLYSPYPHAKIKSIDTSAAEAMPGVKGVEIIQGPGSELKYHGDDIAMVAAETEERAADAVRAIKVEYEILPHNVDDTNPEKAEPDAKPAEEATKFDDAKFDGDDVVVVEGKYGIPAIAHCCLEPHGLVAEWTGDEEVTLYLSTQNVSGSGNDVANHFKIPVPNSRVVCNYVGGGFGSKFSADRWGVFAARLAKKTGKPAYACSVLAIEAQGKQIKTVEGLGPDHPMVQAFVDHDAEQCGFCTPGFVMACAAFASKHPNATREQIEHGLGGNLCRCGTYMGIKGAVLQAAKATAAKGGLV